MLWILLRNASGSTPNSIQMQPPAHNPREGVLRVQQDRLYIFMEKQEHCPRIITKCSSLQVFCELFSSYVITILSNTALL